MWDCFSDFIADPSKRPEDDLSHTGCAGWEDSTIVKWNQSRVIKVFRVGIASYVEKFDEELKALRPLLNLEFEFVRTEEEADFRAYVGVTKEHSKFIDLDCIDAWGCATWDRTDEDEVTEAEIAIWIRKPTSQENALGSWEANLRTTIRHEILHVLVPMRHSTEPTSLMNTLDGVYPPTFGRLDEEVIRLHSNFLVKPGMSLEEVRDLIVIVEDTTEPTTYEIFLEVYNTLKEEDSVKFSFSGEEQYVNTSINRCESRPIGLDGDATLHLGNFDAYDPGYYALQTKDLDFYAQWEKDPDPQWTTYIKTKDSDSWAVGDWEDFYRTSDFVPWRADPLTLASSLVAFYKEANIEIVEDEEGNLRIDFSNLKRRTWSSWYSNIFLEGRLVVNSETYQIQELSMEFDFIGASSRYCVQRLDWGIETWDWVYGLPLTLPEL